MPGSWPTMMVIARPKVKPRSTGRETKPVRLPSRRPPAARKHRLTSPTAIVASASLTSGSPGAVASTAPRIAADEEVGDMIAKRLRPMSA